MNVFLCSLSFLGTVHSKIDWLSDPSLSRNTALSLRRRGTKLGDNEMNINVLTEDQVSQAFLAQET